MIGKAYPVLPPRIHLLTELTEPGFNDCRDLVKDIMPKI